MDGIRAWAAKHVTVTDGLVAAGVAGLSLPATLGGDDAPGVLAAHTGVEGAGWLWFAAVHACLVWRRRAPVVTAWAALGLVVACVASGVTGVFVIFVPIVVVYTVARHAAVRALAVVVTVVALLLGAAWLRDPGEWPAVLGVLGLVATAASWGTAIRARRRLAAERDRHRRQRLKLDAKAAVAAERARLAREVHDVVAHNLAVMVALADGALATIGPEPDRAADMMDKAATTGREALAEMRRVVKLLRDGDGDGPAQTLRGSGPETDAAGSPPPLAAALQRLVDRVRLAGLDVDLSVSGTGPPPDAELAACVNRVVQESVTNVLKHAGSRVRARILVRLEPTAIDIEVVDVGTGPRSDVGTGPGHGLAGLSERVAVHHGTFQAGPGADGGWRVHARLPCGPEQPGRTRSRLGPGEHLR